MFISRSKSVLEMDFGAIEAGGMRFSLLQVHNPNPVPVLHRLGSTNSVNPAAGGSVLS